MKNRKFWIRFCGVAMAGAVLLSMASKVIPMEAQALTSDEIQSQIEDLQDRSQAIQDQLAELEQQKTDNYTEIQEIVARKGNIEQQVNLLYQQVENISSQISAYSALIAEKQEELDAAQARFDELNAKNKERIRAMEEDGTLSYWSVLFKANSFSDFLDRLNMVQEIAASDQRRLEEMNQAAHAVSQARETLMAEKAALEATKAELAASEADLLAKQQEAEELLSELIARGEEYQQLIAQSEERQNELLNDIAQKEVERTQALQAEWEAAHPPQPTEPEPTKPSESDDPDTTEPDDSDDDDDDDDSNGGGGSDAPSSSGWLVPCSYVYVSSPFSDGRMHPILGYVRPHNGIDLAAYLGNPVYASRSGYVTVADYESDGAGNYVFINHGDGFSSVYMHMNSYIVDVGDYVSAGQVIGYVGTTGLSEGPHLHFGIAYNGTYVNPANYIDF